MRHSALFFTLALLVLGAAAWAQAPQDAATLHYTASLNSLNNSGVTGTADITLSGTTLTITIVASGLEPNKLHMQHIHGKGNSTNSTCPGLNLDTNGDGIISFAEGLPAYGPVVVPLQPYPTPSSGALIFNHTYDLQLDSSGVQAVLPLPTRAIVLHGLTLNGTYVPSLPVACGAIVSAQGGNQ